MKQSTRRTLFWIGVVLILLPTILAVITFFQPREYQSSVFIELDARGVAKRTPLIDRDTLYGILCLIGVYLPGVALVFITLLSRRRELKLNGTPTI